MLSSPPGEAQGVGRPERVGAHQADVRFHRDHHTVFQVVAPQEEIESKV